MPPKIYLDICDACGVCVEICPGDVLFADEKGMPFVKYPKECWHCGSCRQDCPRNAIKILFPPEMLI